MKRLTPPRHYSMPGNKRLSRLLQRRRIMAGRFYWFGLAVLAAWRITHLLSSEDGPWRLSARLRRAWDDGFWANLLNCFYCLSLWVSAPLAYCIGTELGERALLWPAISAGAILLERLTARADSTPPAGYFEHEESGENAMLR